MIQLFHPVIRLSYKEHRSGKTMAKRPVALAPSLLALALFTWPREAGAYRPFDSTDASVCARGELEIELGPLGFLDDGGRRFLVVPDVTLNLGLADGLELVVQGRHARLLNGAAGEPRSRVTNTGVFLKTVLHPGSLQGKDGPSVATELGLLLPTLDDAPGAGVQATVILSQRWRFLAVHLNAAAAVSRAQNADLFAGVILEGPEAWRVRPVAELFVEDEISKARTSSWLTGVIGRVRDDLSIDAGLRFASVGGASAREVRAGLTWAFPVWDAR
jgi:hypothetical protein